MASEVDVCNLALAHNGDEANIASLTEGSAQSDHCKRFYPIARNALLEMHHWNFALQRKALALLSTDELPDEWAFAYGYPACIKVIAVYPAAVVAASQDGAIFDQSEFIARAKKYPFTIETLTDGNQVIYSNVEDATVLFTRLVTDTTKFTAGFVIALARLLAAYLAGPLYKGKVGMEMAAKHLEWFEKIDGPRAKAADASAGRNTTYDTFIPSGLAARN